MSDFSDRELLEELGVEVETRKDAGRTPRDERIIAGFEEIQRFVEQHGHPPQHGEDRDIFERLYAVRANMAALKGSFQPLLTLGLLAAAGAGPKMLQDQLVTVLARNATAVMTNVPGPQQPLYLAGGKIERFLFWVPQSGDIGMGVSILSYNDEVQFGLITDRGLCPDPERVIARFAPEFEKLALTTLMALWPRDGDLDPQDAEAAVAA